jgi:hypothetical protein
LISATFARAASSSGCGFFGGTGLLWATMTTSFSSLVAVPSRERVARLRLLPRLPTLRIDRPVAMPPSISDSSVGMTTSSFGRTLMGTAPLAHESSREGAGSSSELQSGLCWSSRLVPGSGYVYRHSTTSVSSFICSCTAAGNIRSLMCFS